MKRYYQWINYFCSLISQGIFEEVMTSHAWPQKSLKRYVNFFLRIWIVHEVSLSAHVSTCSTFRTYIHYFGSCFCIQSFLILCLWKQTREDGYPVFIYHSILLIYIGRKLVQGEINGNVVIGKFKGQISSFSRISITGDLDQRKRLIRENKIIIIGKQFFLSWRASSEFRSTLIEDSSAD